jgi:hypothetical protein
MSLYVPYYRPYNTTQTSMPPVGFFFSFGLSGVFPLWSIFVLFNPFVLHASYVPYYCPYTTNSTQTSMPPVGFFLSVRVFPLWSIFVLFNPFVLHASYVPYYCPYTTNNTNIHGIRTHNPSKRAAEDPRLRPHGHWDRRIELKLLFVQACKY